MESTMAFFAVKVKKLKIVKTLLYLRSSYLSFLLYTTMIIRNV